MLKVGDKIKQVQPIPYLDLCGKKFNVVEIDGYLVIIERLGKFWNISPAIFYHYFEKVPNNKTDNISQEEINQLITKYEIKIEVLKELLNEC